MSASMFTGDAWEAAANRHLLQHIREQMALNSRRYGRPIERAEADIRKAVAA